jgi:hypothetical protein
MCKHGPASRENRIRMSEEIKKDKGRRKNLEVHAKRLAQQLKERNAKLQ